MYGWLFKWATGKTLGRIQVGTDEKEDPYYEEIPKEELGFFQRQGAKRKKPIPQGLSKNDGKILNSIRNKAYQLDLVFECCCGCRMGWAGLIGVIPWIGDLVAVWFALSLVNKAKKIDGGLPKYIEAQMMANVGFDFGIGLIPIVGDLINIAYKSNTRNCILLENYLTSKVKRNTGYTPTDLPHVESSVGTTTHAFPRDNREGPVSSSLAGLPQPNNGRRIPSPPPAPHAMTKPPPTIPKR